MARARDALDDVPSVVAGARFGSVSIPRASLRRRRSRVDSRHVARSQIRVHGRQREHPSVATARLAAVTLTARADRREATDRSSETPSTSGANRRSDR